MGWAAIEITFAWKMRKIQSRDWSEDQCTEPMRSIDLNLLNKLMSLVFIL